MTDAQQGWYLRHRDGVQHGPFQFTDILEAAKLGNVAADTCVRHETQTLDEWVIASRVQAIASVMRSGTPRQGPTRVARAPSRTTAAPRRTTPATASSSALERPVAANASMPRASPATAATPKKPGTLTKPGTPTTPDTATTSAMANAPGEPVPVIHRRHEQGYAVPKSFRNACLGFFDVRFRVFVTPWIITILWSLAILGLLIGVGKLGYEAFLQEELASAEQLAADGAQGHWEFEPLADQPFLKTKLVHFFWQASLLSIGLLVMRVLCEAAVVLLRAATDLHELKSQTKP